MPSLIETSGLTHRFGSLTALDDVGLTVPAGRIGLVGANGAGKTTLIKILLGMLRPAAGTASVLGVDVAERRSNLHVGYMPEDACLPTDQTAADFVGYAAELAGVPHRAAKRRASEALYLVGLEEERFRYLADFSTGMLQRVKLAQAIVHDPQVVFLDEPASGLDPQGRGQMLDLIGRLGTFGISVVFSTHIIADIEATCEWVIMLDGGRLLRSTPLERLGSHGVIRVDALDDPTPAADWLRAGGVDVSVEGTTLLVASAGADPYRRIRDALAETRVGIRSIRESAVTLEEAFFVTDATAAPPPDPPAAP